METVRLVNSRKKFFMRTERIFIQLMLFLDVVVFLYVAKCVIGHRFIVTLRLDSSRNISVHLSKLVGLKHLFTIKDGSIEKVCKMFIITPESLKGDIFLVSSVVGIIHMSPFLYVSYIGYS